jgi:hypothetical protein
MADPVSFFFLCFFFFFFFFSSRSHSANLFYGFLWTRLVDSRNLLHLTPEATLGWPEKENASAYVNVAAYIESIM